MNKKINFKNPPQLLRYKISEKKIQKLKNEPTKIGCISLYLNSRCNLNCQHCLSDANNRNGIEISTKRRIQILNEAYKLGAKELIINGAGEPLMDKGFWKIIKHASKLGMYSIVYTNATLIDKKTAEKIFKIPKLSINAKKYSFSEETANTIFGGNFFNRVENGLNNLIKAGMNQCYPTRLGIQCTILSLNYNEIPKIFQWARKNHIIPQFNRLHNVGRTQNNKKIINWDINNQDYLSLIKKIQTIDKNKFKIKWPKDWKNKSPIIGSNCSQPGFWIAIDECGLVKGCNVNPNSTIGEIRKKSIKNFLLDNKETIQKIRNNFKPGECIVTSWDKTASK